MWELLKNAWMGWLEYTTGGKYAALLLAVLLFLWMRRKKEQKLLLYYTSLMAGLCIFPVSGALLMMYQTRFYDYQWIWNLVPVTLVIAFGATVFITEYWESYKKERFNKAAVTLLVFVVILLCGSAGNAEWEKHAVLAESEETAEVLELLSAYGEGEEICLWAPQEVMEYARAVDGGVKLLYGRNMWEKWLNAYSYDTYCEEQVDCYLWMTLAEENGELEVLAEQASERIKSEEEMSTEGTGQRLNGKKLLSGADCAKNAAALGVNRILLPGNMNRDALQQVESALGVQSRELAGFYLFVLP